MKYPTLKQKILLIFTGLSGCVILLEFLLCLTSFFYADRQGLRYSMPETDTAVCRVVCLGDSYTYGMGVDSKDSYPAQLEEILNSRLKTKRFKVFNLGFPNFTTTMILRKFKDSFPEIKPEIVVVMAGRSDAWQPQKIPVNAFFAADGFRRFVEHLKVRKLLVILAGNIESKFRRNKPSDFFQSQGKKRPSFPPMLAELIKEGNGYRSSRCYREAEECYLQAIKINPGDSTAYVELSRCYKLEKDYEKALDVLRSALDIDPADDWVYEEINNIFILWESPEKGVDFYTKLQRVFPENKVIRIGLAQHLVVLGDNFYSEKRFKDTIDCYNRAIVLAPENKRIYAGLLGNLAIEKDIVCPEGTDVRKIYQTTSEDQDRLIYNNLMEIAKICKKQGMRLIFSGYPQTVLKPMQRVAAKDGISLVEHRQMFEEILTQAPRSEYFLEDGHCTNKGYRLVAENIADNILRQLNVEY